MTINDIKQHKSFGTICKQLEKRNVSLTDYNIMFFVKNYMHQWQKLYDGYLYGMGIKRDLRTFVFEDTKVITIIFDIMYKDKLDRLL